MKNYNFSQFILLMLLSLFLFNCNGGNKPTTSTPNTEQQLMNSVKNVELKKAMEEFKKTKKLRDSDSLLLVLDENISEPKQIELVKFFITGNKNITPAAIYAVLFKAIEQKKETLVRSLLNQVPIDEKIRDKDDRSLLHFTVVHSSSSMVDYLRLKGFSSNVTSKNHGTPLHYVIAGPFTLDNKPTNAPEERKAIVGILLQDPKVNIKLKNPAGETAEELAKNLSMQTGIDNKKKEFYERAATELAEKAQK